jgi:hypothetical protein
VNHTDFMVASCRCFIDSNDGTSGRYTMQNADSAYHRHMLLMDSASSESLSLLMPILANGVSEWSSKRLAQISLGVPSAELDKELVSVCTLENTQYVQHVSDQAHLMSCDRATSQNVFTFRTDAVQLASGCCRRATKSLYVTSPPSSADSHLCDRIAYLGLSSKKSWKSRVVVFNSRMTTVVVGKKSKWRVTKEVSAYAREEL